jgi:hypothetical protein
MDGESDSEGSSFFARMRKSARPRDRDHAVPPLLVLHDDRATLTLELNCDVRDAEVGAGAVVDLA